MRVIRAPNETAPSSQGYCLAIGFFDGVHLGHQEVIRRAVAEARSQQAGAAVVTFDRHPNAVVAPSRNPPLIHGTSAKLRLLESLGVELVRLIHFDSAFSHQTGEEFIRGLLAELGTLRSICVGANFVFGHRRSGDLGLLRHLGEELHFHVEGVPAVELDGKVVSSTRIRDAIRRGDLAAAGRMLGRHYTLAGTVVRGDGIGRRLGFATANLDVAGLALPPGGVYAIRAVVDGNRRAGVLNLGHRPTLGKPEPELRVEAHLLDFDGELYGKELEVEFGAKLRDERKFGSLEELREQIGRDVEAARRLLQRV